MTWTVALLMCALAGFTLEQAMHLRLSTPWMAAICMVDGLLCAVLAAAPILQEWLGLAMRPVDQIAMTVTFAVGLWVIQAMNRGE